jgi:hypothetical protein
VNYSNPRPDPDPIPARQPTGRHGLTKPNAHSRYWKQNAALEIGQSDMTGRRTCVQCRGPAADRHRP